jgi:hypothetical protein
MRGCDWLNEKWWVDKEIFIPGLHGLGDLRLTHVNFVTVTERD